MDKWYVKFRGSECYADYNDEAVECRDDARYYTNKDDAVETVNNLLELDFDVKVDLIKENGKPYVVKVTGKCKKDNKSPVEHAEVFIIFIDSDGTRQSYYTYAIDVMEAISQWNTVYNKLTTSHLISVTSVA